LKGIAEALTISVDDIFLGIDSDFMN
ncbi:Cro/CI family transcriptional regulator, partial [Streptococcus canis]